MAVTPLAVSDVFVRPSATYVRLPQPYVLYVGRRGLYKNFRVLLQAFAGLSHRRRDLHLVCVGGGPFLDGERQHITSLGVERHVVRVDLDDAQLGAAYREATCFVFPSKIEGFGLPVLEALASGCPTLLADIPIFREIGADAALYFSPDDVGSLLDLLERASADRDLRRRLAADGQLRSRQFTWEQTARRSLRLYRTLLDGVQGAH
jgi:glycosyltransferase involved in cell wall biosynthesis